MLEESDHDYFSTSPGPPLVRWVDEHCVKTFDDAVAVRRYFAASPHSESVLVRAASTVSFGPFQFLDYLHRVFSARRAAFAAAAELLYAAKRERRLYAPIALAHKWLRQNTTRFVEERTATLATAQVWSRTLSPTTLSTLRDVAVAVVDVDAVDVVDVDALVDAWLASAPLPSSSTARARFVAAVRTRVATELHFERLSLRRCMNRLYAFTFLQVGRFFGRRQPGDQTRLADVNMTPRLADITARETRSVADAAYQAECDTFGWTTQTVQTATTRQGGGASLANAAYANDPRSVHENVAEQLGNATYVREWRQHYARFDAQFDRMHLTQLTRRDEPPLVQIDGFLSPAEAKAMLDLSFQQGLEPSLINRPVPWSPADKETTLDTARSSRSFYWLRKDRMPALELVFRRMTAVTGLPRGYLDPQFLEYREGAGFARHHDGYKCPYTVFLYLNDVPAEAGGATHFLDLNVTMQPRVGRAILWKNGAKHDAGIDEPLMYQ
jgi:hypothetical protein